VSDAIPKTFFCPSKLDDFLRQTAPAGILRMKASPQRLREHREIRFCLSGDADRQNGLPEEDGSLYQRMGDPSGESVSPDSPEGKHLRELCDSVVKNDSAQEVCYG
jgi:hypothetical protein